MKTGRYIRGLLVAAPLAAVLVLAGCSSSGSKVESNSTRTTTADNKSNAEDEAVVRGLLNKVNKAWEQGDATAYASFHTPDANLVDFRGTHAVGRRGIIDLLQPAFDGVLKNTRVEARIVDFRFLSPGVAIFHTEGQIVPTGANSVQTFVATKGADGWLIAAFQNTRIQGPS